MVTVTLWAGLVPLADGQKTVEVEARDIRELFRKLGERYPALTEPLMKDVAVVIDGDVYRDNWSKELPAGAEVFLMRRLTGG